MSPVASKTVLPVGTWNVDPVHTTIGFQVTDTSDLFSTIIGRFTDFEGRIEGGDEPQLAGTIRVASVNTDNEQRDAHLRSSDLLDTSRFPEIRFKSSRIEHVDGDRHTIAGELTVKEVALPVELDAKFQATGKDADGVEKTLFRVQGDIEWGPTRVEITADITAIRS